MFMVRAAFHAFAGRAMSGGECWVWASKLLVATSPDYEKARNKDSARTGSPWLGLNPKPKTLNPKP